MSSLDTLKILAPEFAELDDPTLEQAITLAVQRISAKAFGVLFEQAAALLAAHILSRARGSASTGGLVGPVTSISEGDLSISSQAIAGFTGADASIASTPYGAQFLELRNTIPTSPFT